MNYKESAEYYFIQLLIAKNWELLTKENRKLYDVMYDKYEEIFYDGIKQSITVVTRLIKTFKF